MMLLQWFVPLFLPPFTQVSIPNAGAVIAHCSPIFPLRHTPLFNPFLLTRTPNNTFVIQIDDK